MFGREIVFGKGECLRSGEGIFLSCKTYNPILQNAIAQDFRFNL
jgi:hypothetical protein